MTLLNSINIGGNTYGITGAAVLGASSTPAGSEVKVCTFTDGFELKAGDLFLIKFTYANTYGDGSTTYPKLQVNGTNYIMRRADGNYVQSGEWGNNATLTFLFDGTDFILPAGSATGSTGVPLGSVIAIYSNSVPDGYLPCNGVQFDPAQFAALYAFLGDDHTPDLRECALVGIGENATDTIAAHDVYALGEFKDDQMQKIIGKAALGVAGVDSFGGFIGSGFSGAISGGDGKKQTFKIYDTQSSDSYSSLNLDSSQVTRTGTPDVTRGKRKGVNYIIKATSGLPDNQQDYILNQLAPVDEVTAGNMHSVTSNAVAEILNYSTQEKIVGYWVDGTTPVYEKTYTGNGSGATTNFVIDTLANTIITEITGTVHIEQGSGQYRAVNYTGSANKVNVYMDGVYQIILGGGYTVYEYYITVRYMKTM